jgi:ATP-dependent helicase/nuclease subunit B
LLTSCFLIYSKLQMAASYGRKWEKNNYILGTIRMAVQFILGRSGTGKTTYCINAIVDTLLKTGESQPLILLVPEQATYQAERAILSDKRVEGYHHLHVLSFARLQFLLSGKHTAKPAATRIGQQMIIQRILRDNKSKLKVFGSSAGFPGLGRQIAETIDELHQYAKTPDDIDQLLSKLQKDERNSLTEAQLSGGCYFSFN